MDAAEARRAAAEARRAKVLARGGDRLARITGTLAEPHAAGGAGEERARRPRLLGAKAITSPLAHLQPKAAQLRCRSRSRRACRGSRPGDSSSSSAAARRRRPTGAADDRRRCGHRSEHGVHLAAEHVRAGAAAPQGHRHKQQVGELCQRGRRRRSPAPRPTARGACRRDAERGCAGHRPPAPAARGAAGAAAGDALGCCSSGPGHAERRSAGGRRRRPLGRFPGAPARHDARGVAGGRSLPARPCSHSRRACAASRYRRHARLAEGADGSSRRRPAGPAGRQRGTAGASGCGQPAAGSVGGRAARGGRGGRLAARAASAGGAGPPPAAGQPAPA